MPLTLHPHLKRGLAFDDYQVHPDDIIEHVSPENTDAEEQEAKRRRIEKIASQCLQGRPPVMFSAALRGPFNGGWKNPWTQSKKVKHKSPEKLQGNKNGIIRKDAASRVGPRQAKRRTRSGPHRTLEPQPVASPETSRAVQHDLEDYNESHTLEEIEVPPATAPSSDEHNTAGVTEIFSMDTEKCVRSRSPPTNPFWLQRPESAENFNMKRSANDIPYVSLTPPRSALQQPGVAKTLRLAAPKRPLGIRNPPARAPTPDDIKSSASAPMFISSPAKQKPIGSTGNGSPVIQVERTPAAVPTIASYPIFDIRPAQVQSPTVPQIAISATNHNKLPPKPSSFPPESVSKNSHQGSTSQPRSTREEAQQYAKRFVHSQPTSSSNTQQKQRSQVDPQAEVGQRHSQHGLIASPAPNSSTGFVYKRVSGTKWTIGNAPRSKPRAVNFNSSPATKETTTTSKLSSQRIDTFVEAPAPETVSFEAEQSQFAEEEESNLANEPVEEQQRLRSSRDSQQSAMSTQAVMLLAQLEFQESTFPTSSLKSQRPWSQTQDATPEPMMPELSPAMTPLSVFRPELEQPHPLASVLRGPPMSTQDLFAAASPFAFSTVKKRPNVPQRSNLSITMMPFGHESERGFDVSPRSPTSADDRVSLKAKSIVPSPWSFEFGDHAQTNSRQSFQEVESQQHGSSTSLKGNSGISSLYFTEQLLRNLDTQRTVKPDQQGG